MDALWEFFLNLATGFAIVFIVLMVVIVICDVIIFIADLFDK